MRQERAGRSVGKRWGRAGWTAFALAPLVMVAVILSARSSIPPNYEILGFVQSDQPVYFAAARETVENGGGWRYASPYANQPDAPRIYSHLVFIVMGWLWRAGLSVANVDLALRLAGGFAMAALALAILRRALPGTRLWPAAALTLMFGGGLAWFVGALQTGIQAATAALPGSGVSMSAREWIQSYPGIVQQSESGYGEWQLNLLRATTFANETVYHALFYAAILCLMKGRSGWALVWLALTWWAHPFTGIALTGAMTIFGCGEVLLNRPLARRGLLGTMLIAGLFLYYYAVFLPRFPDHAAVVEQMRAFGASMLFGKIFTAYGAWIVLPWFAIFNKGFRKLWARRVETRVMCAWGLAIGFLVFHDRFVPARFIMQPMHFTRGYLYFPLTYFSFLALGAMRRRVRPPRRGLFDAAVFLLVAAQCADNCMYFANFYARLADANQGYFSIPVRDAGLLRKIDAIQPDMTVYIESAVLNAWIPVLTHHRSVASHYANTPDYVKKTALLKEFEKQPSLDLAREMHLDAVVIPRERLEAYQSGLGADHVRVLEDIGESIIVGIEK